MTLEPYLSKKRPLQEQQRCGGVCFCSAPLGGIYNKMGNEEGRKEKETTSGRGLIKNFGDVFNAVRLILQRLDILVEMLEELLRDKEEEKK